MSVIDTSSELEVASASLVLSDGNVMLIRPSSPPEKVDQISQFSLQGRDSRGEASSGMRVAGGRTDGVGCWACAKGLKIRYEGNSSPTTIPIPLAPMLSKEPLTGRTGLSWGAGARFAIEPAYSRLLRAWEYLWDKCSASAGIASTKARIK